MNAIWRPDSLRAIGRISIGVFEVRRTLFARHKFYVVFEIHAIVEVRSGTVANSERFYIQITKFNAEVWCDSAEYSLMPQH